MHLVAIDPTIGGVLASGDRGTGKSTAIRALAALLPKIAVVVGCRFGCDPVAESDRLCATEDRVVGALDLERSLTRGEKAFEPGLLARANPGFLYIDEVNLLEDHLVDLLIDVAASGENVVEREGLSIRHPARFVLLGSGNPEEGELRPQLLDRFGLSVEVKTPVDLRTPIEVDRRRDAFERNPAEFVTRWKQEDDRLRRPISTFAARPYKRVYAVFWQLPCYCRAVFGTRLARAVCRLADDEIDLFGGRPDGLQSLRDRLAQAYEGRPMALPADRVFARTVAQFAIPAVLPSAKDSNGMSATASMKR